MVDEFRTRTQAFLDTWQQFAQARSDAEYFANLMPTAIGWKFTDRDEVMQRFAEIRDNCEQVHFGWINERWIICVYLKDVTLPGNIKVIKLMERRPGSTDAVGLDHVDFYCPNDDAQQHVEQEDIKWTEEKNGDHCKWISVWTDAGEAKLRTDTVLNVCAQEMLEYEQRILGV
ncbi:MAG TPA: hypothetical protein VJ843_03295 [Candidatus Saccharimonadales bacterium]|nr:hypothetical protein [Candidatus Saccharimonadales bacterium]